jgi:hypothetical protein
MDVLEKALDAIVVPHFVQEQQATLEDGIPYVGSRGHHQAQDGWIIVRAALSETPTCPAVT